MRRATLGALLILLIASCGAGNHAAEHETSTPATPAAPVAVPPDSFPQLTPITAKELEAAAAAPGAKATLVNVWASWCGPCRMEFPDLLRFGRAYQSKGLRLVLVSVDFPEKEAEARQFLAAHGAPPPGYIQSGDVMNFINTLNPSWSGAIPASFVYDAGGHLVAFHEGMASYDQFRHMVAPVLGVPDTVVSGG
jgi:thiol-disulfide isomerase/thioredoxin